MQIPLPENILAAVMAHARETLPQECCGFLLQDGKRLAYRPAQNVHPEPLEHFAFDPDVWADIEDGGQLFAIAHSHVATSAAPSINDLTSIELTGVPWLVVNAATGDASWTAPSGYAAPLEGRPYCYGVHDCWTLVRDWYATQGIVLDRISAPYGWWLRGEDVFRRHLAAQGFAEIPREEAQPGDMLLFQFHDAPVPRHLGVLLDGGIVLHHVRDRLSRREVYGSYWRDHTVSAAHYVGRPQA